VSPRPTTRDDTASLSEKGCAVFALTFDHFHVDLTLTERGGRDREMARLRLPTGRVRSAHDRIASSSKLLIFSLLLLLTTLTTPAQGIKFDLEASTSPHVKCIWNYALSDTLVVITINNVIPKGLSSSDENDQRVDVEIVDGSKHNNVYLSKKNLRKETRMAINTHSHADLGVCLKNTLRKGGYKSSSSGYCLD
jgi:hypothetical protein